MGYAADRINSSVTWHPLDERWYMPSLGLTADAGVSISAETVWLCDVVKAAVQFKANAVSVCPPSTFRRNGLDREPVPDHYSQRVLRSPNPWQTGFEWSHLNVVWISMWGNAYHRIIGGASSFVEQLRPLHPARMRIVDQRSDGALVYEYQQAGAVQPERLQQEEVLHYHGISTDGFRGLEIYQLIRNCVGIALAAEKHTSVFLRKGTRVSGVLSTEKDMTDDVKKRTRESWQMAFGGVDGQHSGGVAVMGDGLKFTPMAANHREGQFVELNNQIVEKLLRHLDVPGIVVGYTGDKASTYASAKEFWQSGGIKHCILPLVVNIEQRENKALLLDDPDLFIKRNLDVLQRGSTEEMFNILVKAAGRPILRGNEARALLDLNRDDDPSMDKVMMPVNMSTGTGDEMEPESQPAAPAVPVKPAPKEEPQDEAAQARLRQYAHDNAARVVRREVLAVKGRNGGGLAVRHAKDSAAFANAVREFYAVHDATVIEIMRIEPAAARAYCDGQAEALIAGGPAVAEAWEETVTPQLAALALGE